MGKPVRDVPMGAELKTSRGDTILEYWGDSLTKQVVKDAVAAGKKNDGKAYLLGAVSDEYWKAIQLGQLPKGITPLQCVFEGANEENTRKGRSSLARWVIRKEVTNLHELKDF